MTLRLGRAAAGRPCRGRTPGACATDDGGHAELDHGRTDTEKLRDTAKVVRSDRRLPLLRILLLIWLLSHSRVGGDRYVCESALTPATSRWPDSPFSEKTLLSSAHPQIRDKLLRCLFTSWIS